MGLLKAVYLNSARWRLPGLLSAEETEAGGPDKGNGPDLPVFRGEDDRDTRSCQLCFLPRELLFNVSCAENKRPL